MCSSLLRALPPLVPSLSILVQGWVDPVPYTISQERSEEKSMTQHAFKPVLLDLLRHAQISQHTFIQELSPSERAALGTPELWTAKDHIAHMTFWRQRLVLRLQALLGKTLQPPPENFGQLNPIIFEEQRTRSWSDILLESDHVYAELLVLTEQVTEEDLTSFHRFDWTPDREPLYTFFMGNCYEHTQQHLAQYFLDRHDPQHALDTYAVWASRVVEADVPNPLKGSIFYNLACFYAMHNQLEQARSTLQQAFTLSPTLKEFALTDPDLVAFRSNQPEEFS